MAVAVREHTLKVARTARYLVAGDGDVAGTGRSWYVLHGYGQLARDVVDAALPLVRDGGRVVAPEALSRFYPAPAEGGMHQTAAGASWMTREARDAEIADYVAYLDDVHRVVSGSAHPGADVAVLGFSQGAATAARWVALGAVRPRMLVLWGGTEPDDLDEAARARLAAVRIVYVHGDRDRLVDAVALDRRADGHAGVGATVDIVTFSGGHRLDAGVLERLGAL